MLTIADYCTVDWSEVMKFTRVYETEVTLLTHLRIAYKRRLLNVGPITQLDKEVDQAYRRIHAYSLAPETEVVPNLSVFIDLILRDPLLWIRDPDVPNFCYFLPNGDTSAYSKEEREDFEKLGAEYAEEIEELVNQAFVPELNHAAAQSAEDDAFSVFKMPAWLRVIARALAVYLDSEVIVRCTPTKVVIMYSLPTDISQPTGYLMHLVSLMNEWVVAAQ